jgi:hypothetical protein
LGDAYQPFFEAHDAYNLIQLFCVVLFVFAF